MDVLKSLAELRQELGESDEAVLTMERLGLVRGETTGASPRGEPMSKPEKLSLMLRWLHWLARIRKQEVELLGTPSVIQINSRLEF